MTTLLSVVPKHADRVHSVFLFPCSNVCVEPLCLLSSTIDFSPKERVPLRPKGGSTPLSYDDNGDDDGVSTTSYTVMEVVLVMMGDSCFLFETAFHVSGPILYAHFQI